MPGPAAARVPLIGLTGGLGAGKSTALAALSDLGAATLSTDAIVHELLASDGLRDRLTERFGPEVAPGGTVDRSRLAERVFAEPAEREWLESLLWPCVRERVAAWRDEIAGADPPPRAAVVEVPLLFESGSETFYEHTIAVVAAEEIRAERAATRGHAAVDERAGRQLSQDEKAARADHVVRNDGSREELDEKLSRLLEKMRT